MHGTSTTEVQEIARQRASTVADNARAAARTCPRRSLRTGAADRLRRLASALDD